MLSKTQESYTQYDKAYSRETKKGYSEILLQRDIIRDNAFMAFKNLISACSNRNIDNIRTAANRVVAIIERYGWSAQDFGYSDESAALKNIIGDLTTGYTSDITLLGASAWLSDLQIAQQSFEDAYMESTSVAPPDAPTLFESRKPLINSLRSLLSIVDLQYQATGNETLENIIVQINNIIDDSMTIARASATRKENKVKPDTTELQQQNREPI